ncbi:MAG: sensor histidine kinase [Gammaproteobacteria bacterium]|nr:sensor histidine kinase [Gammaproteobacteria bacterium]
MPENSKALSTTSVGDSCFLPNFCNVQAVFAVVITAQLLALVLTLNSSGMGAGFSSSLSLYSLFIQWVALTWAACICLLRPYLSQLPNWLVGILLLLLILLITFGVSALSAYVLELHNHSSVYWLFLLKNMLISAIVAALMLRYIYLQFLWRQQVVAESQAHLQSLQSRIRPHFLFNSMNTIASLIRNRPEIAEDTIHDLSDLFRASLSDARNLSTLGNELELARGYLRIEGQRLGERLQVTWDLDELPLEAKMPALMLQPLLENAVYHGIEPTPGGGAIEIVGRYRRHRVNISIRNSQPPETSKRHSSGNQMAMENIRQRLQSCYQGQAGLTQSEVDDSYQVRLFLPHPWIELT